MFDEEPDDDPHGRCQHEIHSLESKLAATGEREKSLLHESSVHLERALAAEQDCGDYSDSIDALRAENEELWRECADARQDKIEIAEDRDAAIARAEKAEAALRKLLDAIWGVHDDRPHR